MKIRDDRKGQGTTEYMLIIAVIVIGLVASASHFIPKFNEAVDKLSENVSSWLVKDQAMSGSNN